MVNDKPAKLEVKYVLNNKLPLQAFELEVGTVFRTIGYDGPGFYIVAEPVGLLTRSTTVQEQQAKGRVLTFNTYTHRVCYIDGPQGVEVFNKAVLTIE
jgi:hypothetical protein